MSAPVVIMHGMFLSIPLLISNAAFAQNLEENSSIKSLPDDEEVSAEEYWTEERMRSAVPLDPPEVSDEEFRELLLTPVPPQTDEEPKTVEPSNNSGNLKPLEETPTVLGQVQRANVNSWPFKTGGKLFFTKPSGGDFSCSAEFVGSSRVIMTAAHCVMDGSTGAWYKNFNFRQGYANGGGTLRGWECMSVKSAWHSSGPNYPYDYAFIYASSDSGDYLGIKTLIPYNSFWPIGYPSNFESGQYMQKVQGTKGNTSGGTVAMNGNPFGRGSSGGAWIGDLNTGSSGANNYAIGLNSFFRGSPNPMYSPYFNNTTFGLWEYVRDKKCTQ